VIAGAIYQTGQFTRRDSVYVWAILAGYAIGLLATTLGRLYASMYYSLKDTRTPLRYAVLRIFLSLFLDIYVRCLCRLCWDLTHVGSGRAYGFGWVLWMAGACPAAEFTERKDRKDWSPIFIYL